MRRLPLIFGWMLILVPTAAAWAAGERTMQAMVLEQGRLRLASVPVFEPGPGEVRIEVHAAGVNPADWKIAHSASDPRMAARYGAHPILGLEAAGIIDAVGPSVTEWRRGEPVIAITFPPHGSYAQYVVVSTAFVAPKPRSMTYEEAAGIPIAGVTAWRSLIEVAHLTNGQRVLIDGGAGGVGSAAVQIAKAQGAYVVATASKRHLGFLRSIGADEAIDYTAGPFEQKVKDMDVVLETADLQNGIRAMSTLKPGGLLVSVVGAMPEATCKAARIRCAIPGSSGGQPATAFLEDIGRLVEAGKYHVSVERALPLRDAAQAWRSSEQHHTQGKLILVVR
ncbi:MAG TPA: NADP-dependent oxidoreductase [Steroidobacteraceae bacterium]|nr:NADP-dependent oxidoreductase [Steroidobacteraceae bacterium]